MQNPHSRTDLVYIFTNGDLQSSFRAWDFENLYFFKGGGGGYSSHSTTIFGLSSKCYISNCLIYIFYYTSLGFWFFHWILSNTVLHYYHILLTFYQMDCILLGFLSVGKYFIR